MTIIKNLNAIITFNITIYQIKDLMNIPEFDESKFCCLVTNGDYGANPFIVAGTYIKDNILQVKKNWETS